MEVIGVIGALEEEVATLIAAMDGVMTSTVAGMDFARGTLAGHEVVVSRCGVGKVNAAMSASLLCGHFGVDVVVNTGVAGSLDATIDIGDIVVSSDAVQHDVEAVALGFEPGKIPYLDTLAFTADERLVASAVQAVEDATPDLGVQVGRIASGDQFVAEGVRKDEIVRTFGALCCEMEGAAVAQVCHLAGVPFVVMRAISDKADDSAHMDYPTFMAKAAVDCARIVMRMVSTL